MELRYENLKDKPETFLAFTGLNKKEFQILLKAFTLAWELYVQQNSLPLELRQRDYGGGRKSRLSTCEEKLLFILVYFKIYPLQEVLAFHFDMSQSQACEWIHILSQVLRMSLKELGHIPERDAQKVKELLESYMDESVNVLIINLMLKRKRRVLLLMAQSVADNALRIRKSKSVYTVARKRLIQ